MYLYPQVFHLLLQRGADIEDYDSTGMTPIILATAYGGRLDFVTALVDRNANVHAKDQGCVLRDRHAPT